MNNILTSLESVLSSGYSILSELEKEEPDIRKIETFYDKRTELIEEARQLWTEEMNNQKPADPANPELDPLRNIFTRLYLLEKNLDRNLKTLKDKKTKALGRIEALRKAKKSYQPNTSRQAEPLFLDLKPSK